MIAYNDLTDDEIDVLFKLYRYTAKNETLDFDDVPSKDGRNGLIDKGLAQAAFSNPMENCDMILVITNAGIDEYKLMVWE